MAHGDSAAGRIVRVDGITPGYHQDTRNFVGSATLQHKGDHYVVARDAETHGDFHLLQVDDYKDRESGEVRYYIRTEPQGAVYQPIHPTTKPEDVIGARYAFDDGTHWKFAHCSPAEHIDFAAEAQEFARGQFDDPIASVLAIGLRNATSNQARNTAHAKATALGAFARQVGQHVHDEVVGEVLGHWHRNPHADHKRSLAAKHILRRLQVLRQNAAADSAYRALLARIEETAKGIAKRLTASHTIEWRHERYQRFLKLSARGQDPLGGHEFIFTASVDGEPITGDANLPDGSWGFDDERLADGLRRGLHVYYDGYPLTLSINRPYGIRFSRPVGGDTWTQEPAFKVYGGTS